MAEPKTEDCDSGLEQEKNNSEASKSCFFEGGECSCTLSACLGGFGLLSGYGVSGYCEKYETEREGNLPNLI